jgi:ADP-ribose pyrophosphatase YjhB (NUDIX family)
MNKLEQSEKEQIAFSGKIIEVIKKPMKKGDKIVEFEIARRAPGVRLIIVKENKILLSKEFRYELDDYDYRLPGGKAFDTLREYREALRSEKDLIGEAAKAAEKECLEETGLKPKKVNHFYTAGSGGPTIKWDLYYFVVNDFEENKNGQNLEIGEIIKPEWKTFEEAKQLCFENKVHEDRTVSVLLKYFNKEE